jgi:hypothetical protein
MKENVILTITPLLSILFLTFHLTDGLWSLRRGQPR